MPAKSPPTILFYVQHLLGIGHLRRASLIARAIVNNGMACHVVIGGPPTEGIDWSGAVLHTLPALQAADSAFSGLVTLDGEEPDDAYWAARTDTLLDLFEHLEPAALLIELYPFGRRAFRRELKPLLKAAQQFKPRPRILCSVRDILVDKGRADRNREAADIATAYFDAVLVHGSAAFIPFDQTFPMANEIAALIQYTGYVADSEPDNKPTFPPGTNDDREVIVAAGGGAVGRDLMLTSLAARPLCRLHSHRWRFLIGPNLDAETIRELRAGADSEEPGSIIIEPNRPDYPTLLCSAALSISQGGYNTVMDLMRARCPAVVVPFADGGESEQTFRTSRLTNLGYLSQLDADQMTPETLAATIDSASLKRIPDTLPFGLDGALQSARLIADMIALNSD